jgi:hypothetical protein
VGGFLEGRLFLRPVPEEFLLEDAAPEAPGDPQRVIGAVGVQQNDLVRLLDALEACL